MRMFLVFAGIAAGAMVLILYSVYRKIFYVSRRKRPLDPYAALSSPYLEGVRDTVKKQIDELSLHPCEEIRIKAKDGVPLFGRYYSGRKDAPVCILFHGYKSSPHTDLSGVALTMLSHGIGTVIVDQRAHGKSGGVTVSFGIKERFDCLRWANYAEERFGEGKKIVLFGISMGAASVLMSTELDLPSGVCAVIADCPYSEPSAIIKRVIKNRGLPAKAVYPIVYLSALLFGRFSLSAATARLAIKKARTPILLIHGDKDNFVPHSMSEDIHSANPDISKLFTASGAGHCESFAVEKERYAREVLSFIDSKTS